MVEAAAAAAAAEAKGGGGEEIDLARALTSADLN